MGIIQDIRDKAKALQKTIVLPESDDSRTLDALNFILDKEIAKVSVVGIGMRSHSGIAAKMFEALADRGINIAMISTSEIKISCVVAKKHGEEAVRAVHDKFGLGKKKAQRG